MLHPMRRVINPTKEEIDNNEKNYLETSAKLEAIEKEYCQVKSTLRCRYCGGKYYSRGYCVSCFNRINSGMPLKRGVDDQRKRENRKYISKIYEECFGENSDLMEYDFQQIVEHSNLDERTKAVMNLYFIENYSYRKIGEKYDVSGERVRQMVNRGMRKCNLKWKK